MFGRVENGLWIVPDDKEASHEMSIAIDHVRGVRPRY